LVLLSSVVVLQSSVVVLVSGALLLSSVVVMSSGALLLSSVELLLSSAVVMSSGSLLSSDDLMVLLVSSDALLLPDIVMWFCCRRVLRFSSRRTRAVETDLDEEHGEKNS